MSRKSVDKLLIALNESIEGANKFLERLGSKEYAEKWDRKYINDLPNAAFAVVESGYKEGGNKNARHIPHHTKGVKSATENSSVDLSHYRNGLARVNQIKSVLGKESDASLRKKAANHLAKHRAVLKSEKASFDPVELKIWEECEKLFRDNIIPLLEDE